MDVIMDVLILVDTQWNMSWMNRDTWIRKLQFGLIVLAINHITPDPIPIITKWIAKKGEKEIDGFLHSWMDLFGWIC